MCDDGASNLQATLSSKLRDGFLCDVEPVSRVCGTITEPSALAPWASFSYKLFRSATATDVIKSLLEGTVPGTTASYATILSAIASPQSDMSQRHYCYLVGGQLRDLLSGKLAHDFDFNYSCTAQHVASVCVQREWAVKYKTIGPGTTPNYVLIGDESSDCYLEGFSLSFNAAEPSVKGDFRRNMLFYDLTNHLILDKTGSGVDDIRGSALRLPCAAGSREDLEGWLANDITRGLKCLRYVKFILRAATRGAALRTDDAERAFVVASLRLAMRENGASLQAFWFNYALGEATGSQEGIDALFDWVLAQDDGAAWWDEWLPFLKDAPKPTALLGLITAVPAPKKVVLRAQPELGQKKTKRLVVWGVPWFRLRPQDEIVNGARVGTVRV